jgi:hypothetical protein
MIPNKPLGTSTLCALAAGALLLYATQAATCAVVPSGLVSCWSAEGSAIDAMGVNSGTLLNGATFAPGKVGEAFSFNGVRAHIRIPDAPSLRLTKALTVEAWVYPTAFGGLAHEIISKFDHPSTYPYLNQRAYTFAVNSVGKLYLLVSADGGTRGCAGVPSTDSLPLNQWSHVAGTYDGAALRLYINGSPAGQIPYSSGIFPGSDDLSIGGVVGGVPMGQMSSAFAGKIDEPAIYSRALSAAEILAIYNAGPAGKGSPTPALNVTSQPASQPVTPLANVIGSASHTAAIANSLGSVTSGSTILATNPAEVSISTYVGVTIEGVPGATYGIQATTDLIDANGWRGVANITLEVPKQLWIDVAPATQPQRFYRVVPGPISIP